MEAPSYIQLKPREEVCAMARASIVVYLWKFALLVVFSLLPFFFLFALWRQGTWGIAVFVVWLIIALVLLLRVYTRWARTVFLVTDTRVIDHDQRGLFFREITQARYDQIDEVSVKIKGIAPTLFRYGTISLKLRGVSADIEIQRISRPNRIADIINDLRDDKSSGGSF